MSGKYTGSGVTPETLREQGHTTLLCDEHGWRWFFGFDIESLAYHFVAIPVVPWEVFLRLTGYGSRATGTRMISDREKESRDDWIEANGVSFVWVGTHFNGIDPYIEGHRVLRTMIEEKIAQRPMLSTKHQRNQPKEDPDLETEAERDARLHRDSRDFYSHQQRTHTYSEGGARLGPDLQSPDGAGPLAQRGHR